MPKPPARHQVIYDTDPGVDDAMAMYYALAHPEIEVVGVTTTFGNVSVVQAVENALYLLAIAGRGHIPVTQGVGAPLGKPGEDPPAHIHGADGLGNLTQRQAHALQRDPRSSAHLIVDMARKQPGEITVVAVGPLGNLALALEIEPQLPQLLRAVVIMGGTVLEPGNVSPVAEANIWNDPHAADRVFCAGFALTMVGLDVTHQVILPVTLFKQLAAQHRHIATDTLHHAVAFYANFYSDLYPHVAAIHGCFGHDVLAFVALTDPQLFTTETGALRVVVDGLAQGQTMLKRKSIPYPQDGWQVEPVTVCMQVQSGACRQKIEEVLMREWLTT